MVAGIVGRMQLVFLGMLSKKTCQSARRIESNTLDALPVVTFERLVFIRTVTSFGAVSVAGKVGEDDEG